MSAKVMGPFCVFDCPKARGITANGKCSAQVLGAGAPWRNIGTEDAPTLEPSYHCVNGCGWHGYIVDGEAVNTPSVSGAVAVVTMLHACINCQHPELISVSLTPGPTGMGIAFHRTTVREGLVLAAQERETTPHPKDDALAGGATTGQATR